MQGGNSIQNLYEGDQSKLYSGVLAHHDTEGVQGSGSKKQIGRIWKITLILAIITIVEVVMGLTASHVGVSKGLINTLFIGMTLLKAFYIVRVFMHLGDEFKNFIITVLIPLFLFVWFIIAFLADGHFWLRMNESTPTRVDQTTTVQPR